MKKGIIHVRSFKGLGSTLDLEREEKQINPVFKRILTTDCNSLIVLEIRYNRGFGMQV